MLARRSAFVRAVATVLLIMATMSGIVGHTAQAEPQAVVAPQDGYGFAVGAPMSWMSDIDADRELDAAAKAGATWQRIHIDWSRVEPMPGAFNWGYVDHWIDGAWGRGLRPLGMILYTPEWARAPGTQFSAPPVDPVLYARFVTKVVQRYRDRVSDWELWNEPNVPYFFGNYDNRAARYTALLKVTYPAVKMVQPNSTVIAAGMSRAWAPEAPPIFVKDMYALGAKDFFDALAMHPYVYPKGLAIDDHNGWSDVERVRRIMVDNGDADKKIWMTEIGAPTSAPWAAGVSQEEQARQITDVMRKARESGFSGPVFIYSIRDTNSADPNNDQHNFGSLLTTDWRTKFTASVLAK